MSTASWNYLYFRKLRSDYFEKSVYPQFNIEDSSKDALINGTDPEEVAVGFNSFFKPATENDDGFIHIT